MYCMHTGNGQVRSYESWERIYCKDDFDDFGRNYFQDMFVARELVPVLKIRNGNYIEAGKIISDSNRDAHEIIKRIAELRGETKTVTITSNDALALYHARPHANISEGVYDQDTGKMITHRAPRR